MQIYNYFCKVHNFVDHKVVNFISKTYKTD